MYGNGSLKTHYLGGKCLSKKVENFWKIQSFGKNGFYRRPSKKVPRRENLELEQIWAQTQMLKLKSSDSNARVQNVGPPKN